MSKIKFFKRFVTGFFSFVIVFSQLPLMVNNVAHAANQTWNAGGTVNLSPGEYTYDACTVTNNTTLVFQVTTGSPDQYVTLNCSSLTIDSGSKISSDGQGYAGGAVNAYGTGDAPGQDGINSYKCSGGGGGGHGNVGGQGGTAHSSNMSPYNWVGGVGGSPAYGSNTAPVDAGSGGGGSGQYGGYCVGNAGSAGGGIVRLNITGKLTVNGDITANGVDGLGVEGAPGGGGGAGGSIYITAGSMDSSSAGNILAYGGAGGDRGTASATSWHGAGGGGGGGRISITAGGIPSRFLSGGDGVSVVGGSGGTGYSTGVGVAGSTGTLYTEVSNQAPSVTVNSVSQMSGQKYVVVNYTAIDADGNDASLATYEYSLDNSAWSTMTERGGVGSDGTSALSADAGGDVHDFMWDIETDLNNTYDGEVWVRLKLNDGSTDSDVVTSSSFAIDTLAPTVETVVDLAAQPVAGSTTVSISASFTEDSPNTNNFYVGINGGEYGSSTAGTSDTAAPGSTATAVGATLDGNDYVSKVRAIHTDDFAMSVTSENIEPNVSYKYVKPYTPQAPTTNSPTATSLDVTVNKHTSEVVGLEYAIYETTTEKYVQTDGSLGDDAVWQNEAIWGTKTVTGLASPVSNYSFKVKSRNTSDTSYAVTSESEWSSEGSITNTDPSISFISVGQSTDGTKYVTVNYKLIDEQGDNQTLLIYGYSPDGSVWTTMTEKDGVGSEGLTGLSSSSEGDSHNFMWDVGTNMDNTEDESVYVRLMSNDGIGSSPFGISSAFVVDTLVPSVSTTADLTAQPNAGDTSVLIDGAFNESNPDTNDFYVAVNDGEYGTVASGDSDTSDPTGLAVATGVTLDGNDYISKVKISHTDDYDNLGENENLSPNVSYKYVKPYTPQAPTVDTPTSTSVNVAVNKNSNEVDGLSYAIYEIATGQYVQSDGTLGAGAVWQDEATWGTKTVTGLASPVSNYSFQVKSRNSSDSNNAASSESALSAGASIENTTSSIDLNIVEQTTDGSGYVSIDYIVYDAQSDIQSISMYEYSVDNETWFTMTEKSDVGSDGKTGLASSSEGTGHAFMWDVANDLANTEDETVYVRLATNDGVGDGATATSSAFEIDVKAPEGLESFTNTYNEGSYSDFAWSQVSDGNFDHYEIWYSTDSEAVGNRADSATEWDDGYDSELLNIDTVGTRIEDLEYQNEYTAKLWAVDSYGNESTIDALTFTSVGTYGNSIIEMGEQCDDGNLDDGDGCSSICQITTQCNDGVDNDGDGNIDLDDAGCSVSSEDNESYSPASVMLPVVVITVPSSGTGGESANSDAVNSESEILKSGIGSGTENSETVNTGSKEAMEAKSVVEPSVSTSKTVVVLDAHPAVTGSISNGGNTSSGSSDGSVSSAPAAASTSGSSTGFGSGENMPTAVKSLIKSVSKVVNKELDVINTSKSVEQSDLKAKAKKSIGTRFVKGIKTITETVTNSITNFFKGLLK